MTATVANGLISWKYALIMLVPAAIAAVTIPVSISVWLLANHETHPHQGTVTMELYLEDIRELKSANRELRQLVEGVRSDIQRLHTK